MKEKASNTQIVIYKSQTKGVDIRVKLDQETVWLSQKQMADLFDTERSVITKHINNIIKIRELQRNSVCAKFAHTAEDGKIYRTNYYSLDMIISVGYRVNSKQGVAFRTWATKTLKDYLIKGYVLNEKRLKEGAVKLKDLKKTMGFMQRLLQERQLNLDESTGLLHIITAYSYALATLDAYDHNTLTIEGTSSKKGFPISYNKATGVISKLKKELIRKEQASNLFGQERGKGLLESCLNTIYQTFGGKYLYPSLEEKAAHLLYLIVKNHPFTDGNKRIGAFFFIWFLNLNKLLYSKEGRKRIADNALISLTLLIAESKPQDKEIITHLVVNLINKRNK